MFKYLIDTIKEHKKLTVGESFLMLLLFVVWVYYDRFVPNGTDISTPFHLLVQFLISAVIIIFVLLLAYLDLRQRYKVKPDFSLYKFEPAAGSWINRNSSFDRICAACKADDKFSPLYLDEDLFLCPTCGKTSKNVPTVCFSGTGVKRVMLMGPLPWKK